MKIRKFIVRLADGFTVTVLAPNKKGAYNLALGNWREQFPERSPRRVSGNMLANAIVEVKR